MNSGEWRSRAGTDFTTIKHPATASRGMVVTNHPLGSAAGAEMLAAGGNAVDAAIASLFALSVVEPMMVGIFGAGVMNIRLASGEHLIIDDYTVAPDAARPDMFRPVSNLWPDYMKAEGDLNTLGHQSVGVPGTLKGWCEAVERFGTLGLEAVMQPAIRHAERGFRATTYLCELISESASQIAQFPETAKTFLPGRDSPSPGHLIVQRDYAHTLRTIAREGPEVLYGGALGSIIVDYLQRNGGLITMDDLRGYRTEQRRPVCGTYRGYEVYGAPPPTAGGVHLIEMLNILEGYDLAGMGFGSVDSTHLLAEAMKLAFADRNAYTGDPAFIEVPVEMLMAKGHAEQLRLDLDIRRASPVSTSPMAESAYTTHVTVADADGNIAAMTQTINNAFGSKVTVPGTGILLNNTMAIFDPHPGMPNSIAPGKRVTSSMAPTIVLKGGRPAFALGLPGGVRIFTSVLQGIVNVIDHGMSPQEAVEAPRVWTQGQRLEVETGIGFSVRDGLTARGHDVATVPVVGGGMSMVAFNPDGSMTGAACWRADGTPIGLAGGYAKAGIRFNPDAAPVRQG